MEIIIDGETTVIEKEGLGTFKDLLDHVETDLVMFPRVITRIILNEEELDEAQEIGLGGFSVTEVMSLEIHTADHIELAHESLADAQVYLPELASILESSAAAIREGNVSEGIQVGSEALEYIGGFGQVLDGIRSAFLVDFSQIQIDDFTLLDKLLELNINAGKVLDAMKEENWTLFADLIEYEIAPLLYQWMAVIPELVKLLPQCAGNGEAQAPDEP